MENEMEQTTKSQEAKMVETIKPEEKDMSVYNNWIKEDLLDPGVPAPFRRYLKDVDKNILKKYGVVEFCYDQNGVFDITKLKELCQYGDPRIRKELRELMQLNKKTVIRQFEKWCKKTGFYKEWKDLKSINKQINHLEKKIMETEDLLNNFIDRFEQKCKQEADLFIKLGCSPANFIF